MDNKKNPLWESMRPVLEEKIGEILYTDRVMPGTYYIETDQSKRFSHEYYAVLETAPIAAKVQKYGEKMGRLRLFAWDDPHSGCKIVKYEINKYRIAADGEYLSEALFRDMSLHAMELHPEYFGTFPVPFHTNHGYTLLHRTLSNGIYWLETSECKELLAVCSTIWRAELSYAAKAFGKFMEYDHELDATGYLFFSKEASCIPIYELMETRKEWDGTVIKRPALMNAIWAFQPEYALHLNGRKGNTKIPGENGMEAMPEPNKKAVAGIFPGAGTDFLLLK